MTYKIGIYIEKKGGEPKLVKWLEGSYESYGAADLACREKNKQLGVGNPALPAPGQKFAMFTDA